MAAITVKLFGVLRLDSKIPEAQLEAQSLHEVFDRLNESIEISYKEKLEQSGDSDIEKPEALAFKDAVVFINGERCKKKNQALNNGDEVWLMSPASGG